MLVTKDLLNAALRQISVFTGGIFDDQTSGHFF